MALLCKLSPNMAVRGLHPRDQHMISVADLLCDMFVTSLQQLLTVIKSVTLCRLLTSPTSACNLFASCLRRGGCLTTRAETLAVGRAAFRAISFSGSAEVVAARVTYTGSSSSSKVGGTGSSNNCSKAGCLTILTEEPSRRSISPEILTLWQPE